jgi:hypothetical protein
MSPQCKRVSRIAQRFLKLDQYGLDFGDFNILSTLFNDFESCLTCPLGRLGAARQPAAGIGFLYRQGEESRFE